MIEYWKDALYLLGILGAFIGGNRAKKIQNKSGDLDNLAKYQLMYDKFVSQYETQYSSLRKIVDSLQNDIDNLNLRNAIILEESESWKKRFNELQKLYDKLKKEFENYKKDHR